VNAAQLNAELVLMVRRMEDLVLIVDSGGQTGISADPKDRTPRWLGDAGHCI